MKHVIVLGVIALALALFTACSGGGGGSSYPLVVEANYMSMCIQAAGGDAYAPYCRCTLNELEKTLDLGTLLDAEAVMLADPTYLPDEVKDAIIACLDEAPVPEY